MGKNDDLKTESLFKKFLTSEVKFVISIIFFVGGIVAPYYSMRTDIALIQKDISIINLNHEAHIQDIMEELKDLRAEQLVILKAIK